MLLKNNDSDGGSEEVDEECEDDRDDCYLPERLSC